MKTFEDLSTKEIQELVKQREEAVKKYWEENKINKILLLGIGYFGNKVVSKVKDIQNVYKLCSCAKSLNDNIANIEKLIFLSEDSLCDECSDKNDYDCVYKQVIQNEKIIIEKIKSFDYIIICTDSDNQLNGYLTEIVSDICKKICMRFMVCHSIGDSFYEVSEKTKDLSSQRSKEFIDKMKNKKYILNEFPYIYSNFLYDKISLNYSEISYFVTMNTGVNPSYINEHLFANVLEMNITRMLNL